MAGRFFGALIAPWTDHPPELTELRLRSRALDRALARLYARVARLEVDTIHTGEDSDE